LAGSVVFLAAGYAPPGTHRDVGVRRVALGSNPNPNPIRVRAAGYASRVGCCRVRKSCRVRSQGWVLPGTHLRAAGYAPRSRGFGFPEQAAGPDWAAQGVSEGPVGWVRPWRPVGGGPGTFGIRESIFKFSHTKSRQKFQNLDPGPDSTRKSLHGTRWVYVGGEQPESRKRRGASRGASLCKPSVFQRLGPR